MYTLHVADWQQPVAYLCTRPRLHRRSTAAAAAAAEASCICVMERDAVIGQRCQPIAAARLSCALHAAVTDIQRRISRIGVSAAIDAQNTDNHCYS